MTREWLSANDLSALTGKSPRYFQRLAASGQYAWARQPGGHHKACLFERAGFEAWLRGEDEPKRRRRACRASTREGRRGGGGSPTKAGSTDNPLKLRIAGLLKSGWQDGSAN